MSKTVQEAMKQVQKPLLTRIQDFLHETGYFYEDADGNPKRRSTPLKVNEIVGILKMNAGFMRNVYYSADDGIKLIDSPFYLDDTHQIKMNAGPWEDVNDTTIEYWLDMMDLSWTDQNVVKSINFVVQTNNKRQPFLVALDKAKQRGHYNPNIYLTVMRDWLHARPQTDENGNPDYTYPIWWLKSLLTAIYEGQSYDVDKNGIESYQHIPNRYMLFGSQGIGKSTFFDLISFNNMYDFNGGLEGQQADKIWRRIAGTVLVNMDDKAYTGKISVNDSIKSAISQNVITFHTPYGRNDLTRVQKAVWVGSTNRFNIYTDKTGDRREYPLDISWNLSKQDAQSTGVKWVNDPNTINNLRESPLQADLWVTFLRDYETNGFNPILRPNDELYGLRHQYYLEHSTVFDAELAIQQLMNRSVPQSFFTMEGVKKQYKVAYLADDMYKGVTPEAAKEELPSVHRYVKLSTLKSINAPVFNTAVRVLSDKKVNVQQITNILHEQYGYRAKRTSTGEVYFK